MKMMTDDIELDSLEKGGRVTLLLELEVKNCHRFGITVRAEIVEVTSSFNSKSMALGRVVKGEVRMTLPKRST